MRLFTKELTARDREDIARLLESMNELIGTCKALQVVNEALMASHPDPALLRETLYPRLLKATLDVQAMESELIRKPYLRHLQGVLQQLLAGGDWQTSQPAAPAPPASF